MGSDIELYTIGEYQVYIYMYSRTCSVSTSKGRQNQYFLSEVLTIRTDICTVGILGGDRLRNTYYPGTCTSSPRYSLSKFHCTVNIYT